MDDLVPVVCVHIRGCLYSEGWLTWVPVVRGLDYRGACIQRAGLQGCLYSEGWITGVPAFRGLDYMGACSQRAGLHGCLYTVYEWLTAIIRYVG